MVSMRVVSVFALLGVVGCGASGEPPAPVAIEVRIVSGPSGLVRDPRPSWAFATRGAPDAVDCAIDGGPAAPCKDAFTPAADLADGTHTFAVRAADAAGDQSIDTRTIRVDAAAPAIALQAPLIPRRTSNQQPVVSFTVDDASQVTTTCSVDGGPAVTCGASFGAAASLAEGLHTYRLTATDAAGNAAVLDVGFDVDITPPEVTITAGPVDPTNDDTPSFSFTTSADTTRARCEMDTGEVIDPCTTDVTFAAIATGARTFTVTAFDDAAPPNTASATFSFVLGACGDGAAQGSEQCDGADLRAQSCVGLGFFTGTLGCTTSCTYDTSGCTGCGNGIIEPGEQCDGAQLGGATCGSLGFDSGALACSTSCTFDTAGCGRCGDGVKNGGELCDGSDVGAATCASLGHAPGALACNATCDGFDASGCDGGFVAASAGFSGKLCFDGVKFGQPGLLSPHLVACTEDNGVLMTALADPLTPVSWAPINGTTAGSTITNLHGRAIVPQPDGPATVYLTDGSTAQNGFRSNNVMLTPSPAWTLVPFADAGAPIEVFAAAPGSSTNNIVGGWDAARGAVVLHGNFAATAAVSAVGPPGSVTGTVRSIAKGATNDIHVAVWGQTPAGDPALGGGIYLTCDQVGTAGGTYLEHDAGIAAEDKPLVWSLTVDPSSVASSSRMCGAATVTGFATTYYAALRGGGQIYKTGDGGATWTQSNVGLPAGAEVYKIAIDCFSTAQVTPPASRCANSALLYAATSAGLYVSIDAGAHWTLAGLEGRAVRGVTLEPEHAMDAPPRIFVAVDDAVGIYQKP
jgi:hypothetical protein